MINLVTLIPMPYIKNLIYREWYVMFINAIFMLLLICYLPISFYKSIRYMDVNLEVYKIRLAFYLFDCKFYYMYPNYKYGE